MKLQSYAPQVGTSQPKAPTVAVSNDVNAYGDTGGGLRQLAKATDKLAVELNRQIENEDRTSVLKAMDAYNKGCYEIMYNEKDGLMHTQGEGAAGVSQAYIEKSNALRQQVLDTFKVQKKDNLAGLVNLMGRAEQQGWVTVNKHQYQEGERVKDAALNNNLTSIATMATKDPNPGSVDNALLQAHLSIDLRYGDAGKDILESAYKKADSQILGATISGAIAQDDFQGANELLQRYGDMLSPQQRVQFSNVLQQKGQQEHLYRLARVAKELYPDDEAEAMNWVAKQPGFSLGSENTNTMSDADVEKVRGIYLGLGRTERRMERQFINKRGQEFATQISDMVANGKTQADAMALANKESANNIGLMKEFNRVIKAYYGSAGNKGRFTQDKKVFCREQLSKGECSTFGEYLELCKQNGASNTDLDLCKADWSDFQNGKGRFKYKGPDLLRMVIDNNAKYNKIPAATKYLLSTALEGAVGTAINDFKITQKREPSEGEILAIAQKCMTWVTDRNSAGETRHWWHEFSGHSPLEYSTAALRYAGIVKINSGKKYNTFDIVKTDGTAATVDGYELSRMLKGTDAFEKYQYKK